MTVLDFNTGKGLYIFQLKDIETHLHSHPALEVLLAEKGKFSFSTQTTTHPDLTFAIIDSNIQHKISATGCELKIVMIEHNTSLVTGILSRYNISLTDNLYLHDDLTHKQAAVNELIQQVSQMGDFTDYEPRVRTIITYMNKQAVEYNVLVQTLGQLVNLS